MILVSFQLIFKCKDILNEINLWNVISKGSLCVHEFTIISPLSHSQFSFGLENFWKIPSWMCMFNYWLGWFSDPRAYTQTKCPSIACRLNWKSFWDERIVTGPQKPLIPNRIPCIHQKIKSKPTFVEYPFLHPTFHISHLFVFEHKYNDIKLSGYPVEFSNKYFDKVQLNIRFLD